MITLPSSHDAGAKGFTVVELLIVIVVIAIIATIGIFAYNGISKRATLTHYESTVDAYNKGILLYKSRTDSYPSPSLLTCIGAVEDYPATPDFPAGACQVDVASGAAIVSVDPRLASEVMTHTKGTPGLPRNLDTVNDGYTKYRGAWLGTGVKQYEIEMVLPDSMSSCPKNMEQYQDDGFYWCELFHRD